MHNMYIFKLYLKKIKCKFSSMFLCAHASIFSAKNCFDNSLIDTK